MHLGYRPKLVKTARILLLLKSNFCRECLLIKLCQRSLESQGLHQILSSLSTAQLPVKCRRKDGQDTDMTLNPFSVPCSRSGSEETVEAIICGRAMDCEGDMMPDIHYLCEKD